MRERERQTPWPVGSASTERPRSEAALRAGGGPPVRPDAENKEELLNRLGWIEVQVRGIRRMVEKIESVPAVAEKAQKSGSEERVSEPTSRVERFPKLRKP